MKLWRNLNRVRRYGTIYGASRLSLQVLALTQMLLPGPQQAFAKAAVHLSSSYRSNPFSAKVDPELEAFPQGQLLQGFENAQDLVVVLELHLAGKSPGGQGRVERQHAPQSPQWGFPRGQLVRILQLVDELGRTQGPVAGRLQPNDQ